MNEYFIGTVGYAVSNGSVIVRSMQGNAGVNGSMEEQGMIQ